MKEIQKRMLLQICIGFFIGRVDLFGINPAGVAYFAAGYAEGGAKIPVASGILLGMYTVFAPEKIMGYAMAIAALLLAVDLLQRRNIHMKKWYYAAIITFASGLMKAFWLYLMPHDTQEILLAFLETGLVFVMTRVFQEGVYVLLKERMIVQLSEEKVMGLAFLGAFFLLGIPDIVVAGFSIILAITAFVTLLCSYCFGIGAGAVAGAIGGCVLIANGQERYMIGILVLLGICIGMLREQGKWLTGVSFMAIAAVLFYVFEMNFSAITYEREIAASGVFFMAFPEKLLWHFALWSKQSVNGVENDCVQKMMQHKLQDFAKYFIQLGDMLCVENEEKEEKIPGETTKLLETMSKQVCARCENATTCHSFVSLFRPEMRDILEDAKKRGRLSLEIMPQEFVKGCIHKERFLTQANQSIHLTNMAAGYQKRMQQSRQLIARQMIEVGQIVNDLSRDLPVVQKLPDEMVGQLERALRKKRVLVEKVAFYEKCDGRLEIHMKGKTGHGRFVTTREVSDILSEMLECAIVPREECRKVFSKKAEEFVFEEGAQLTAVTGISRLSKDGEERCGDTFSNYYLPDGELLVALSDGMGSGDRANAESERLIEMLEQMTEIGFSEVTALRLINSYYVTKQEHINFATADIALLNLYQKTCQFVKCGASITYLYRDGKLYEIQGEALPIGVMAEIEPYTGKSGINAGDYVIMMTDGIADSFDMAIDELENLIMDALEQKAGPKDLSDSILQAATERMNGECTDDMSVLVVKLYDNLEAKCKIPWMRRTKMVS